MSGKVMLVGESGKLDGQRFEFNARTICLIGRGRDCGIRLPDDAEHHAVSRSHCLLDINPPDARIRDFGSLNGTEVNGVTIGRRKEHQSAKDAKGETFPEHDLKHGDSILLGTTSFRVEIEVPIVCRGCEVEISTDQLDACREESGVYFCQNCSVPSVIETVIESVGKADGPLCANCGADVSAEMPENRHGELICQKCQSDPQTVANNLLRLANSSDPELQSLHGYEAVRQLGHGGMGAVYLVRHVETKHRMALKIMLPRIACTRKSRTEFLREISVTKSLTHPNIVQLNDYGNSSGTFFFTLEYCDGNSVDSYMKKQGGKLTPEIAVGIARQALKGLEYAHQAELSVTLKSGEDRTVHGIVHRDLSPQNLFLTNVDGKSLVKVGDFGLAKAFDTAGFSGHTFTQDIAGKPAFMAREQVTNYLKSLPQVDVWAMAASLYNMLTGAYPREFEKGRDPWQIVLTTDPVPIQDRDSSISNELARVIDNALVDSPNIAVKSANQFRSQLRDAMR